VLRAGTRSFCALHSLRDFAVERRQAALLLGQEPLLQQLADDALDRFRQAPLAFAAAGLAGHQVRHKAAALPGTPDQDIHLPPGQAQRLSSGIGGFMPDHSSAASGPMISADVPGLRPCLIGQGGHALLGNRWGV
jgi:hypothetical protein